MRGLVLLLESKEIGQPIPVELPSTEVYDVMPLKREEALNFQAGLLAQKGAALQRPVRILEVHALRRNGI